MVKVDYEICCLGSMGFGVQFETVCGRTSVQMPLQACPSIGTCTELDSAINLICRLALYLCMGINFIRLLFCLWQRCMRVAYLPGQALSAVRPWSCESKDGQLQLQSGINCYLSWSILTSGGSRAAEPCSFLFGIRRTCTRIVPQRPGLAEYGKMGRHVPAVTNRD